MVVSRAQNEHHPGRTMDLHALGWNDAWQQQLQQHRAHNAELVAARVVRAEAAVVTVWSEAGSKLAHLPARLKSSQVRPAIGDWVVIQAVSGEHRVEALLSRQTVFVRRAAGRKLQRQVVAANVDVVFVVSGLDGDFNPRRIERYLTTVRDGRARPVVLLTKAAQCDDVPKAVADAQAVAPGVAVIAIDVVDGVSADAATEFLSSGSTVALVGSSGVGKSTLLNYWAGEDWQAVAKVRARDNRGQHTTTRRELFALPTGALVIDTPGMRELALWADAEAVSSAFADIDVLSRECRFRDCRHIAEPDCAVQAALKAGQLDPLRLTSFHALTAEALEVSLARPGR